MFLLVEAFLSAVLHSSEKIYWNVMLFISCNFFLSRCCWLEEHLAACEITKWGFFKGQELKVQVYTGTDIFRIHRCLLPIVWGGTCKLLYQSYTHTHCAGTGNSARRVNFSHITAPWKVSFMMSPPDLCSGSVSVAGYNMWVVGSLSILCTSDCEERSSVRSLEKFYF